MAEAAESMTNVMKNWGYTPHETNPVIELCPSAFARFIEDVGDYFEAFGILIGIGAEEAATGVSESTGSFWNSVGEFFSTANRLNTELRQYNRSIGTFNYP